MCNRYNTKLHMEKDMVSRTATDSGSENRYIVRPKIFQEEQNLIAEVRGIVMILALAPHNVMLKEDSQTRIFGGPVKRTTSSLP